MSDLTLREKALLVSGNGEWNTHSVNGISELCLTDGPYGIRKVNYYESGKMETEISTCYPTTTTIASSWDKTLIYEMGLHLGIEAFEHKVDVLLGPGINIKRSSLCGRNFEYYSEDPLLSGYLAAEMVKGIQKCGVAATVKHFAVNNQEYSRQVINAFVDERTLREIYLKAFEIVVKESKPYCIMCSYNAVNGEFMSENKYLLNDILREEFGFDGLIMSDWLAVNDRVKGIKSGLDLEMPESKRNTQKLIDAVESGKMVEAELDKCVQRVCELVKKCRNKNDVFLTENHTLFAKKALDHSAVLMKNKGILPLHRKDNVFVIGAFAENPRYQGGGSAHVKVKKFKNFLEKLDEEKITYDYLQGYNINGNGVNRKLSKATVDSAQKYDKIIVFLGLPEHYEVEGYDRVSLNLPKGQLELMEMLKPFGAKCAVVLSCGSAVSLPFINDINALLNMQLGGQAFSDSLFDILYGYVNPSGRLSETYPKNMADFPVNSTLGLNHRYVVYSEGMFIGYRYYDKVKIKAEFPFGFGLSYTKFSYGKMTCKINDNSINITVDVTNVGKMDGEEVVQVYFSMPNSNITRCVKELAGFTKLFIKSGETKTAEITVVLYDIAVYDTVLKKKIIENGEYTFLLAKNAEEVLQEVSIHIDGEKAQMKKVAFYEELKKGELISEKDYDALLNASVIQKKEKIKNNHILDDNSCISDYIEHFPHCLIAPVINYKIKKHKILNEPIGRIKKMRSIK